MNDRKRRAATYERVSSEDQRQRETIKTQTDQLALRLQSEPNREFVGRYFDDAVSGSTPLRERPAGKQLLLDAAAGKFDEVWVLKLDRLGRDDVDPHIVRRQLRELGVELYAVMENLQSDFEYGLRVLFAAEERRGFLARSAAGMKRAAQEGRYCGGIVPLGYSTEGKKPHVTLVPSDKPMWSNLSEADVVRRIYDRVAIDHLSCTKVADEFNALAIPTVYQKDGRGVRGKDTQPRWRPGRIRNLLVNPIYRGECQYGRRTKKRDTEIISARVPALVSDEVWYAAQATLAANRIMSKHAKQYYLLSGRMHCSICGLTYIASLNNGNVWYRCGGQLKYRGHSEGPCLSKSIKGEHVEHMVWRDVEGFLWNPGPILDELASEMQQDSAAAVAEAERTTLEAALAEKAQERRRLIGFAKRGAITEDELVTELDKLAVDTRALETRLQQLRADEEGLGRDLPGQDILEELRERLKGGLDARQRQEIVGLLVKRITVQTTVVDGRKEAKLMIEYRFSSSVVSTCTDMGS